jgi:hypothetical protein
MRRLSLFLLMLLPFTTIASAQSSTPFDPNPQNAVLIQRAAAALNPEMVVARMMMFDSDLDGRVAKSELPERMHNLLLADSSGDEALDRTEIRGLARSAPAAVAVTTVPGLRGGGGGGYAFGDQISLSSRSHVEGALEDLRLPSATHQQALSIVIPFMDRLEADASADLFKQLEGMLSPAQMSSFRVAVDRQLAQGAIAPAAVVTRPDGTRVTAFLRRGGADPTQLLTAFGLSGPQRSAAQSAVETFKARIRPADSDRAALLDELKDVLSSEEQENFGAALQRRPLVKANSFNGLPGVVGGLKEVVGALNEQVVR